MIFLCDAGIPPPYDTYYDTIHIHHMIWITHKTNLWNTSYNRHGYRSPTIRHNSVFSSLKYLDSKR